MTTQVTIDDLAAWLGITQRPAAVDDVLGRCLAAAAEHIGQRLGTWVPDTWPDNVEQAVLMQSARLYKRRNSPEGVTGFGDLGIVRVTTLDPDVESMLGADLALWFGGLLPEEVTPSGVWAFYYAGTATGVDPGAARFAATTFQGAGNWAFNKVDVSGASIADALAAATVLTVWTSDAANVIAVMDIQAPAVDNGSWMFVQTAPEPGPTPDEPLVGTLYTFTLA